MAQHSMLHFQEGFQNDAVEIRIDGTVQRTLTLSTRNQIGLAAQEIMATRPGQELQFQIVGQPASPAVTVPDYDHYVLINRVNDAWTVSLTRQEPGYV